MKRLFLTLNILHIFNDSLKIGLILSLPFIAKDLHLDLTQVGFLGSSINLVAILFALPAAYLSMNFGGLRTLLVAMSLYILGYFLTSFAGNVYVIGLSFIVAGMGFGLFHPISFALISKLSPEQIRGKRLGDFSAAGDIGAIGIPLIITFITVRLGWHLTLLGIGCFLLIFFIIFSLLNRNTSLSEKYHFPTSVASMALRKNRGFILVLLAVFFDGAVSSPLYVFLPFLLLFKGLPTSFLGIGSGIYFIGSLVGKTYIGRLVDKFGHTKVFICAELTMGLIMILISQFSWIPVILILAFFLGSVTRGTSPATKTMIYEAAGDPQKAEKAFGISEVLLGLASTLSPASMGYLSDHFSVATGFSVFSILTVAASIPAFFFALHLKKGSPEFIEAVIEE